MLVNDNCRVCKRKTIRRGYLYICKDKSCKAVFWDKAEVKRKIKEEISRKGVGSREEAGTKRMRTPQIGGVGQGHKRKRKRARKKRPC